LNQGEQLRVMGWGLTEEGNNESAANTLQETDLTFQSDAVCTATHGDVFEDQPGLYWSKFICAGEEIAGTDACQGDSGGPLLWDAGSSNFKLAGIVSWGKGCGQASSYGGFVKVAAYSDWISDRFDGLTLIGPNKIGFLGYGRKKSESYRLVNRGDSDSTIINAQMASGHNAFFDFSSSFDVLTVASGTEENLNIDAVGSYLGEHDDTIILNAGGADFGITLNSKVLYDLNTNVLGVNWDFYSGTNEYTEHAEPWFEVEDSEKGIVLRSGIIGNEERSVLLTYVKGPSTGSLYLKFDTKVDAESGDILLVTVNEIDSYTATSSDWSTKGIELSYDVNRVQFIYIKDDALSDGDDAAYLSNLRVCTSLTDDFTCNQLDEWNVSDSTASELETNIGTIGKGGNATYDGDGIILERKSSVGGLAWQWFVLLSLFVLIRSRRERT
jgi:hypothetical protein